MHGKHIKYTGAQMISRTPTLLLIFVNLLILDNHSLYASCGGCSRGESLYKEGQVASAGPGLAGATGPRGATGPELTGATGATGATGSAGGLLDYAFVSMSDTSHTSQSVLHGANIIFNTPGDFASNSTSALSFVSGSGSVKISNVGTYLARYVVTIAGSDQPVTDYATTPSAFTLARDTGSGPISILGSDRSSGISGGAGSITVTGEAVFRITTIPVQGYVLLSVMNGGFLGDGVNTFIISQSPATTSASLYVQQLDTSVYQ